MDEDMFIFPDRAGEETADEVMDPANLEGALKSTADLLKPTIDRNKGGAAAAY